MVLEKVDESHKIVDDNSDEPAIIKREKKAVEFMVGIYCNAKHKTRGSLCFECSGFLEYVKDRLDNCPYREGKTACGRCGLPCYEPDKKIKGMTVFTYSGPRMLVRHPILAVQHFLDSFKEPEKPDS